MPASSALLKTGPARLAAQRSPARAGRAIRRPSPTLAALEPSYQMVLMAVEALDELVADMIRKKKGRIPRDFFDWVADEMTPRLEVMALEHFGDQGWPGMAAASAMRDWVHAVCEWPLEQKIKGMSPSVARQTPDCADLTRASRAF